MMHPFETDGEPGIEPPVPMPPNMRLQFHPIVFTGAFFRVHEYLNPGWVFDYDEGEPWDDQELLSMIVQLSQIQELPCTVVYHNQKGTT